jgi:hypothetical protein
MECGGIPALPSRSSGTWAGPSSGWMRSWLCCWLVGARRLRPPARPGRRLALGTLLAACVPCLGWVRPTSRLVPLASLSMYLTSRVVPLASLWVRVATELAASATIRAAAPGAGCGAYSVPRAGV